jgi:3-oxoacyl-[acyl-carrier-protein] synthase-3
MKRAILTACGGYLPETILTNQDLAAKVDTTDQWIVERTGIKLRHIAAEHERTSDLATHAAKQALERAGCAVEDLDMIILATTTPDRIFPSTATKVQANLGMHHGMALDIQAVCSGFIYALSIANSFIQTGQAKRVLVIGAEVMSRIVDWDDRGTCILFGDGAGAVLLEEASLVAASPERGILSTDLYSDGRYQDILYVEGGMHENHATGKIRMLGKEVFRHAVDKMYQSVKDALAKADLSVDDIDLLVPHQANMRIIAQIAKKLRLKEEQTVVTVDHHANTSAASIPLALNEAWEQGLLVENKLVVMEALGGGLTWGSALVRL